MHAWRFRFNPDNRSWDGQEAAVNATGFSVELDMSKLPGETQGVSNGLTDLTWYKLVVHASSLSPATSAHEIVFFVDKASEFATSNAVAAAATESLYSFTFAAGAAVAAGPYAVCYCDQDADAYLEDLGDGATTYQSTSDGLCTPETQGNHSHHDCWTKCHDGCVGDECFCGGYDAQSMGEDSGTLCLDAAMCRAACDAEPSCVGVQTRGDACRLMTSSCADATPIGWHNFAQKLGTACTHASDFPTEVGRLQVSSRADVGVEYVVEPGAKTSVEITGTNLLTQAEGTTHRGISADRIMAIPADGRCGVSAADPLVSGGGAEHAPLIYQTDAPSEEAPDMHNPITHQTSRRLATHEYNQVDHAYVPGNMDLVGLTALIDGVRQPLAEHQCYQKCLVGRCKDSGLESADCHCDGAYSGYDGPGSSALCLPAAACRGACDALDACESVEVHHSKSRCFLNSAASATGDQAHAEEYSLHVKVTDPNEEDATHSKHEERPTQGLAPIDFGFSQGNLLRFDNLHFPAGRFKLCFCDSMGEPAACATDADFALEVGVVHSSGLSCLLDDPHVANRRTTCAEQAHGGLRCYAGHYEEAPADADHHLLGPRRGNFYYYSSD